MPALAGPFALGRFRAPQGPLDVLGLVVGERMLELAPFAARLGLTGPLTPAVLLAQLDALLPALTALAADAGLAGWQPLAGLTVLPPLEPRQIVQAGANYRTHVVDLAAAHEPAGGRTQEQVRADVSAMMDRRAAYGEPYLFVGLPSAVTGPYDDVALPPYSEQHDWELELTAVIGRPAHRVSREQALGHVAAYTIANDLTTRDLVFRRDMPEMGTDWFRGKNAPGFLPLGPYLVPAAFVGDPSDLRLTLTLNDRVMQDESTKDMLFDVAALVSAASQTAQLLPGDLVLTGSPAGNGMAHGRLLRAGDVTESTITGLGTQRTRYVAGVAA